MRGRESLKVAYRFLANSLVTIAVTALFAVLWFNRLNNIMAYHFLTIGNWLMIGTYMVLVILFINTFGGYKIGVQRISIVSLSQAIALAAANVVTLVLNVLMNRIKEFVLAIAAHYVLLTLVQALLVVFLTFAFTRIHRIMFPPYQMLHIYGEHANSLMQKMNKREDKYNIVAEISCNEPIDKIIKEAKKYEAVLINDVTAQLRNDILKKCYENKIRVYFTPKISDILVSSSEEINVFDTPLYLCRSAGFNVFQGVLKRLGDICISLFGIIIFSPLMLVVAAIIHLYDKGPVFYRQKRCTIDDREFDILKFRSMIENAESDGKARLATEHDSRITPIGKFIRATRIDELPQFFNILKGDMSLVGPRPERPEIIREYVAEVPEFAYRTRVKAGLTGYAQVYGKYNTTSYDKLKLDLIYVQKCSILLDVQLILMTLRVVFTKESTEGLDEGEVTASIGNDVNKE